MSKTFDAGLVWFRRDLRIDDNTALFSALRSCRRVFCCFVLDRDILDPLPRFDRRVEFIHASLQELDTELRQLAPGAGLLVRHDRADAALPALARQLQVQAVFMAHDDEPAALARDVRVADALAAGGIRLLDCKDHLVFERREILTQAGHPYTVFTPYQRAWLRRFEHDSPRPLDVRLHAAALAPLPPGLTPGLPSLEAIGFTRTDLARLGISPGASGARLAFENFWPQLDRYHEIRDFPAQDAGLSRLGIHLRFGTLSIRRLAATAMQLRHQGNAGAAVWLAQLIWRDFFAQILANHPHVATAAFRPEYDAIRWESGERARDLFAAWCEGRTGYPLVDAAMHQLNRTGEMHNRLRMLCASFLVKDLGIDWRWGERYFALKLNDFDLASNNGNWQWASSSGCDAQPWFRIFNPVTQSRKFDPEGAFILRFLPRLTGLPRPMLHTPWAASESQRRACGMDSPPAYPAPIVDHATARERTLQRYAVVRKAA